MASYKEKISNRAIAVQYGDAPIQTSKLPAFLRFPLLVLLSLTISTLLYSFVAEYTEGDLASVSRSLDQWHEVGALVGWRMFVGLDTQFWALANEECRFELGLGWFGNYDGYDLAALSFLSHGPPVSLLSVCDYVERSGLTYWGVVVSTRHILQHPPNNRPLLPHHRLDHYIRSLQTSATSFACTRGVRRIWKCAE